MNEKLEELYATTKDPNDPKLHLLLDRAQAVWESASNFRTAARKEWLELMRFSLHLKRI
ncbi:hypothetical protein [Helicobacter sp. UBA3407]|uniref:hypothetical protein n=1 Tax=Helicobacter TaxID=209 RepID=UPI002615B9CC|nr:hypothetical protein [Helicobacter sp. UBA3407]